MTRWWRACLIVCLLGCALAPRVSAQELQDPAPLQFRTAAEEARFHALTAQLRCVMCQNQSLADSNAQIAHDLRREVLQLMRQGRSDDEIVAFLVARYGEFVRYKPAFEPATWLLWLGPGVLLLVGAGVVIHVVRRRQTALQDTALVQQSSGETQRDAEQEW